MIIKLPAELGKLPTELRAAHALRIALEEHSRLGAWRVLNTGEVVGCGVTVDTGRILRDHDFPRIVVPVVDSNTDPMQFRVQAARVSGDLLSLRNLCYLLSRPAEKTVIEGLYLDARREADKKGRELQELQEKHVKALAYQVEECSKLLALIDGLQKQVKKYREREAGGDQSG